MKLLLCEMLDSYSIATASASNAEDDRANPQRRHQQTGFEGLDHFSLKSVKYLTLKCVWAKTKSTQLVENFSLRNNSLTQTIFLLKLTSTEHFTV